MREVRRKDIMIGRYIIVLHHCLTNTRSTWTVRLLLHYCSSLCFPVCHIIAEDYVGRMHSLNMLNSGTKGVVHIREARLKG